jgi:predicted RNA binding protein YcfA (HicA-like mRNA interferase family)
MGVRAYRREILANCAKFSVRNAKASKGFCQNAGGPSISILRVLRGLLCWVSSRLGRLELVKIDTQNSTMVRDLEKAGWVLTHQKGSDRKFEHAKVRYAITISGNLEDDAHHYQVRDVKKGLRDAQ